MTALEPSVNSSLHFVIPEYEVIQKKLAVVFIYRI